jgi:hypothetical protein
MASRNCYMELTGFSTTFFLLKPVAGGCRQDSVAEVRQCVWWDGRGEWSDERGGVMRGCPNSVQIAGCGTFLKPRVSRN